MNRTAALNELTPDQLADYFTREVFARIDDPTREFLLATAFLPQMTVGMAERLTGSTRSCQILAALVRNQHFTTGPTDGADHYQYHPRFQEFLQQRAAAHFPPAVLNAALRRSAALLSENGFPAEAARLHAQLADWEALATLVLQQAPELLAQGRGELVEAWLTQLPDDLVQQNPWLLFWRGAARMTQSFAASRAAFTPAYSAFDAHRDAAGAYLAWSGIVDSIVYEWADFSRLDQWIAELDRLRRRYPDFPSPEIEMRVSGSIFSALMFHLPQHPEIGSWAERILTLLQRENDPTSRIMAGNSLVLYHLWWSGNHSRLDLVMNLLRPPQQGRDLPPLARIVWISLRGFQEWAAGECTAAQQTFLAGVQVVEESGVHIWDFMLYFQGVVAYLSAGDHRTAGRYLDELMTRIDRSQQLNLAHCCYVAAWQAVLAKKLGHAREHVRNAIAIAEELGGPFTQAAVWAAWTQVEYVSGERNAALEGLEKSLNLAREIQSPILVFRGLMVKAAFALDAGEEESCLAALREGLKLGRHGHYLNFSWWQGPLMTRLCIKALEAGIEVDYVRELVRRRGLLPAEPPLHLANWPWPLCVQTLGHFAIHQDDQYLAASGKTQKKPLELLKLLIALGGKEAYEGQCADLLWPHGDGDAARVAFSTTLHRLRQFLGHKEAIVLRDGRLGLDRRYVHTDVWAFQERLRAARQRAEMQDETGARRLTEEALAHYHGPFLVGEEHTWLFPLREQLAARFVAGLQTLAEDALRHGDHRQAETWYQRGLELEPLSERLYRGLIRCHLAAGEHAEASLTYLRCKKILASSLGVEPSAATTALYRKIGGMK